jgi:hypothetical protein
MMSVLEAEKLTARANRLAYESKLQQEEDDTYRVHFLSIAKLRKAKLLQKIKKRPQSERLKYRLEMWEESVRLNATR